ncbi:MAG: 50S ribosomal protein L10 [Euryarchaeota archaeon]|nr:50S ribosomal protein L10 [Euryarchaeota archaeon]
MQAAYKTHRPAWKDAEVASIKEQVQRHSITAIVSIKEIPAQQLQKIRAELRAVATLKVARNTLIYRALEESGEQAFSLFSSVEGQTALIFTELSPFRLFKLLESSRRPAPAKAGDIAPQDIIVEKGPTSFRPGPIVGDLQNAGIPAAIEKGKIVIRESKTVVKAGERINARVADVLQRLEIFPMEVGLYLRAAYDGETLYRPEDLYIDEQAYAHKFVTAVSNALHLSINAAYPTRLTISALLQRGLQEAVNLAVNAEIFEPDVIEILLSRAQANALTLTNVLPDEALDEQLMALKGSSAAPAQLKEEAQTKKEKETEEEREEEQGEDETESGAAGLGSLFE